MEIKLGHVKQVGNTKRRFGSNLTYNVVYVKNKGNIIPLLLTDEDISEAQARANVNKEDLPCLKKSFIQWFFR